MYINQTVKRNKTVSTSDRPAAPELKANREFARSLPTALSADEVTAGFRDPSFGRNKQFPVHRWVPWVAGFSAQFVNDCLKKYIPAESGRETWVLDPFAGVGTTLLEAYLHGYSVLGFEINPYAVLATTAKLEAFRVKSESLADNILKYQRFMDAHCGINAPLFIEPSSKPPEGFSGRMELYRPAVQRRVLFTLDFIKSIRNRAVRDLFKIGLGSVMVSFSNYTYEPSLTRRTAVDKSPILDDDVKADVKTVLLAKMNAILDDVVWIHDHVAKMGKLPRFKVIPDSIFSAAKNERRKNFVDIAITSPPYLNNYHYPRNTRPQIHWLGFSNKRGYEGANESKSFGKFWQSVRDRPDISLQV